MARAKRASKQKRRRMAFPALGAAGVSLADGEAAHRQLCLQRMYRREIPNSAPSLRSMRRKFPTSAWPRSMSSTRKPPEHLSSAKAYNLPPAAEVAAAEAAEAAQFEAAEAAAAQAAEAA